MDMPNLGDVITVRPTAPNIESHPATGRFFAMEPTEVGVTDHIVRRLLDGALVWVRQETPAAVDEPVPTVEKRKPFTFEPASPAKVE